MRDKMTKLDFASVEQRVLAHQASGAKLDGGTATGRWTMQEDPPSRPMLNPIWPVLLFVVIFIFTLALGFCLGRLSPVRTAVPGDCPGASVAPALHVPPVFRPSGHRYVEVLS